MDVAVSISACVAACKNVKLASGRVYVLSAVNVPVNIALPPLYVKAKSASGSVYVRSAVLACVSRALLTPVLLNL